MTDPHTPLKPADKKPGQVMPDLPETEAPTESLPEGQLPGMPLSRDPLLNPGPTPSLRETPPLD